MASGKKNYELEIIISGGTDASLQSSIRKARKEISSLEKQAGLSKKALGDTFGGMSVKGIDSLGKMSDKVFGAMAKGGMMAAGGLAGVLSASAAVGMGFEAQMSTVGAISQASAEDMKRLTALAKEMGETTQFSAEEAGQGLEYMAMAGWKTEDMIGGLPGIMYLAAASGEELGTVSDIVTDAMTAFGMSADEAGRFADVLAQASSSSNTNVGLMGETFQYVAPVAGAFGYTIEDVAVATGLMANAGIKGQKAGTALRTALTNLAKPTKEMQRYMSALGISLTDGEGKMKPFRQQLTELRASFEGLTEAEKAEYAAGIAGKEGMSGLLAIVTASDQDFDKLTAAIDNSAGAAKAMSEVRLDNLRGDMTLLGSAAQGAGIEIYEGMSGPLREIAQEGTEWLNDFTEDLRENMPAIQRRAKEFGAGLQQDFGPILDFGGWCLEHPEVIEGTLMGIVTAFGAFKGVQAAKNGVALLKTLSGMASAWPVAAFGAAAGTIMGIATAVKEANKKLKKEDLGRHFGSITLSMEELDETARMIIDNGNLGTAAQAIEEMGKIGDMADSFKNAGKTLDRLNWKIGMGFTLDAGDQEEYADAIEKMVQDSLKIAEQSQYTAHISVQAVFGQDNETGRELIAGFDSMYASINGEVRDYGKQLGDAYSKALEDGVIDVDEARTIQGLQEKLANITLQLSQAQGNAKLDRIVMEYSGKELDPETFKNLQGEIAETVADQKAALGESVEWNLVNIDLQAEREGRDDGWVEKQKQAVQDAFQDQLTGLDLKAMDFSLKSIQNAYGEEMAAVTPQLEGNLKEALRKAMESIEWAGGAGDVVEETYRFLNMDKNGLDRIARENMQDLWETVEPQFEEMAAIRKEMEEQGRELPEAFAESFSKAVQVGVLAGDADAIYAMIGNVAEDPAFTDAVSKFTQAGGYLPEAMGGGIAENMDAATDAVRQLASETQSALDREFSKLSVNAKVQFNLASNIVKTGMNVLNGGEIAHNAAGGLIERPTLSWFAEDSPEMAIPLDGSARSLELWEETGRLLGAYSKNNYSRINESLASGMAEEHSSNISFAPVFSPVIQLDGGGDAGGQLSAGLKEGYEMFLEYMERFRREQYRAAF